MVVKYKNEAGQLSPCENNYSIPVSHPLPSLPPSPPPSLPHPLSPSHTHNTPIEEEKKEEEEGEEDKDCERA